ncbi:MAG: bifunctional UDP-N-acetylglucosamine diphosphorylase/glucosamine-1-phosphate N-acetyltransferase GlmU [Bacillota bacterium]|nr:bifunctional UDP-N-acetylglucosamine diphosphorylase/glucosamine-1-phosphate N-acetyltransferase GlmU [Bacillota bacterium]
MNFGAVIMCAGEGKRMKSALPKAMAEVLFTPMSDWVLSAVKKAGAQNVCIVTGYNHTVLEEYYKDKVQFAYQAERLGTGHAVMQASEYIRQYEGGYILVATGDNPFVSDKTICAALSMHENDGNAVTVITAKVPDPTGYGRIIRRKDGGVAKIVEQKECNAEELATDEVNSSWYIFSADLLLDTLVKIKNNNLAGEYYLTDAIEILLKDGKRVGAYTVKDSDEILGANDRLQLLQLNDIARKKTLDKLMENGVAFSDITGVTISPDAVIGRDTVIHKGTIIKGASVIGSGCEIGPDSVIDNSTIGDDAHINQSVVEKSTVGSGVTMGPFAHLRPNCSVGIKCHVGNFVELKNSKVGDGTKVAHLTYVGDTDCGGGVNFGCGCVTANYDGKHKFRTVIGDGAFIGCNTNLIAPVTVEDNAVTAAGSTITDNVPRNALAIARARQINKNDWVSKRKEKTND